MKRGLDRGRGSGWSLSRRLIQWVACTVAALFLVECGLVSWFVRDTLRRELDNLCEEESAELQADLMLEPVDPERLDELLAEYEDLHPETRFSLRVRHAAEAQAWMTAGEEPSVPWSSLPRPDLGQTLSPSRYLRLTSVRSRVHLKPDVGGGAEVELTTDLLMDGTPRAEELWRLASLFLLTSFAGGLVMVLAGVLFSRRLTCVLAGVAESAGLARLDDDTQLQAPERSPREIRAVVDAFRESIQGMRDEHSRNVLLTAGLAHELRSPLQNLISEAEVGLLSDRDGTEYRRLITVQLEELRSLALVVDNLITLTALRDHGELARAEVFDLLEEARQRLGIEQESAGRRDVSLEIRGRGDCGLSGDREAIVLMLRNLVGNAIRWTREGTLVEVSLEGGDEVIILLVDDHGPGVPAHERAAIFEPFYQGQAPRGTRVGYGLGLALARTAARSAGGSISVGASPSGGARFRVELPRRRRSLAPTGPALLAGAS